MQIVKGGFLKLTQNPIEYQNLFALEKSCSLRKLKEGTCIG